MSNQNDIDRTVRFTREHAPTFAIGDTFVLTLDKLADDIRR